jgi:ribose 5-phosphate isomerase RpiB
MTLRIVIGCDEAGLDDKQIIHADPKSSSAQKVSVIDDYDSRPSC